MANGETPAVRIELFGGPRILFGEDHRIELAGKQGALLALLALAPGMRMGRDDLVDSIWTDHADPETGRNRLRNRLSKTRNAIGRQLAHNEDILLADNDFVWLNRHIGLFVDAVEFDRLIAAERLSPNDSERIYLLR